MQRIAPPQVVSREDISYGGEAGFNQAIELCSDTLKNVKFIQEKRLVSKFLEEVQQPSEIPTCSLLTLLVVSLSSTCTLLCLCPIANPINCQLGNHEEPQVEHPSRKPPLRGRN